jgi:NAD(P)-dependent dehydrogenase (short-subunit alcohol dehydrogenase family)
MQNLSGKTAFITGGASGIGLGIAHACLAEGMQVAIVDIDDTRLAAAEAELADDDRVLALSGVDVTDRALLDVAAAATCGRFGSIDLVCANAGIGGGGAAVADPDAEVWDRVLAVNLGGVVNTVKAIVPGMRERNRASSTGGHVVVTASVAAITALPFEHGAYTASKFGVRGLGESLRLSLAEEGIGVSILCPGLTRTGILDSGGEDSIEFATIDGAMSPLEVGQRVIRGVRANAPYIFTHGEFADEFRSIFDEIVAAVPTDQAIPADRAHFEQGRRDLCDRLRHLPAID